MLGNWWGRLEVGASADSDFKGQDLKPIKIAMKIAVMTADDKITPLPTLLERLGCRIDRAYQRTWKGENEWVEGTLELAQALAEARERFSSNIAFGRWLQDSKHDHVSHQDRAALINLAGDLTLARDVLTKTTRRSYRHIWEEEQGRFTHVGKTDKPKRGHCVQQMPPRQRTRRLKNDPKAEAKAAAAHLDLGMTYKEAATEGGLDGSVQIMKVAAAREEGRRETFDALLEAAAVKNFSDKGAVKIDDAIRVHKARLDKQFEQRVNEEVRRRIDAANDFTRTENKRLRQEVHSLTRTVGERGVFTETQYRQMLMLCHPDSSAGPQLKAALLQVLVENKIRLIRPDK